MLPGFPLVQTTLNKFGFRDVLLFLFLCLSKSRNTMCPPLHYVGWRDDKPVSGMSQWENQGQEKRGRNSHFFGSKWTWISWVIFKFWKLFEGYLRMCILKNIYLFFYDASKKKKKYYYIISKHLLPLQYQQYQVSWSLCPLCNFLVT